MIDALCEAAIFAKSEVHSWVDVQLLDMGYLDIYEFDKTDLIHALCKEPSSESALRTEFERMKKTYDRRTIRRRFLRKNQRLVELEICEALHESWGMVYEPDEGMSEAAQIRTSTRSHRITFREPRWIQHLLPGDSWMVYSFDDYRNFSPKKRRAFS